MSRWKKGPYDSDEEAVLNLSKYLEHWTAKGSRRQKQQVILDLDIPERDLDDAKNWASKFRPDLLIDATEGYYRVCLTEPELIARLAHAARSLDGAADDHLRFISEFEKRVGHVSQFIEPWFLGFRQVRWAVRQMTQEAAEMAEKELGREDG